MGDISCLHLFKGIVQIGLYCVDDDDYNVLLKVLGLEKGSVQVLKRIQVSFKMLQTVFCNKFLKNNYFCSAGKGAL